MTNQQIKILRSCGDEGCKDCPYNAIPGCIWRLMDDAADYINCLKARNEKLKKENISLRTEIKIYKVRTTEQQRLKEFAGKLEERLLALMVDDSGINEAVWNLGIDNCLCKLEELSKEYLND